MVTLILRRCAADAASPDEAAGVVASLPAAVVQHRSERMLLVDVADDALVEELTVRLHGWIVSRQGPRIQVPDTRLKLRGSDQ
ncbi:hypothetical protein [Azohydromonas caseinilytica]|uniref:Uncharacterized protein n=1 Tax=Azohydromonas caseinilytica TaxID=2728836 RepID=A0A848FA59_9BURK|nr:hypothetical protein [Azohydromonas caseinilytica]NML16212.1 hypothetical protein [Azohydromonas caseinilytica]